MYNHHLNPDAKDVRKNAYHLKRGYFAVIKVEGYRGHILIDFTRQVENPTILVKTSQDSDPEIFEMTDQEPERLRGVGFPVVGHAGNEVKDA